MKIYLVTHPKKMCGFNPSVSDEGAQQIQRIREEIFPEFSKPPLIVIGTGQRFKDTCDTLLRNLAEIPVKYSPFCGSGDSMEADNDTIMMSCETTTSANYIGLVANPGFDAWKFVSSLPDGTLLCAGGELMGALGLKAINRKGHLYELDPETKTGKMIS